jgi:excisionase family DNA binding protein
MEPLDDVQSLAEFLRVPRSRIYALAAAGVLPCIRLGRQLRFDRAAVLASLQAPRGDLLGRLEALSVRRRRSLKIENSSLCRIP